MVAWRIECSDGLMRQALRMAQVGVLEKLWSRRRPMVKSGEDTGTTIATQYPRHCQARGLNETQVHGQIDVSARIACQVAGMSMDAIWCSYPGAVVSGSKKRRRELLLRTPF